MLDDGSVLHFKVDIKPCAVRANHKTPTAKPNSVRRRPHGAQLRPNRHARKIATAAGTAKTNKKYGTSSATEYPASLTPTHMLMPAPMSHNGTNTFAAVASPRAGVGEPSQAPMRRHNPRTPKPAAITLIVCATVVSALSEFRSRLTIRA